MLPSPSGRTYLRRCSVRGGIGDSGAGLAVLSQYDLVHEWHAPASTCSSSIKAQKAARKEAIQWPYSISSWASAKIICDCKSLVRGVSNANSDDSIVIQLKTAAAVLAMSKSSVIVWACGHCDLPDNELADHQAKLVAAGTQPDNAPDAATRRALVRRSCRPPFQRRYTPTWLASAVVITLHLDAGNIWWEPPWMPSADCVLKKTDDNYCLQCPALLLERHHGDIGHTMDEFIHFPCATLALLRVIFRCLR